MLRSSGEVWRLLSAKLRKAGVVTLNRCCSLGSKLGRERACIKRRSFVVLRGALALVLGRDHACKSEPPFRAPQWCP